MVRLSPLSFRVVGETSRHEEPSLTSAPDDRDHVGLYLREARESLGRDVDEIALALRIRPAHLEAIEDGRFGDLPGPTYAVGFIRTYADFLGLDATAIVARFKSEAMGYSSTQTELDFIAAPESRFPSGAVVFVGLLVAVGGFVGWSYFGEQSTSVVQRVAEPPAVATAPATPPMPQVVAPAPQPATPEVEPETQLVESAPLPEVAEPDETEVAQVETSTPAPAEPAPSLASLPAQPAETPVAEAPIAEAPIASLDQPVAPAEPSPVTAQAQEPAQEPVTNISPRAAIAAEPETTPALPQVAALPEVPAVTNTRDGGRVYGQANTDARIVLTATVDSWVQVRDQGQNVLLTRMLQPGDSYRVPDQAGLLLLTGNAGGLRVVVDGTEVPSLGPLGAVRRDILLDPDALRESLPTP